MIYPIKRKIKESKMVTEGLKQSSIEGWLRDSVAAMTADEELTISRYFIDSNFGFYVFWSDGFDPNDDSVIHATAEPSFALVCGLKIRNDAEWDGDYMDSPYDPKTGDLYVEDIDIPVNGNYKNIAAWLIEDYNTIQQLLADGEIIAKINESKSIRDKAIHEDTYGYKSGNRYYGGLPNDEDIFGNTILGPKVTDSIVDMSNNDEKAIDILQREKNNPLYKLILDDVRPDNQYGGDESYVSYADGKIYWVFDIMLDNDCPTKENALLNVKSYLSKNNISFDQNSIGVDEDDDGEDVYVFVSVPVSSLSMTTNESKSIKESYVKVDYICDGTTNFRIIGGGFNTDDALVSVEDENGKRSRLNTGDVIEFYSWYDAKGNVIREPEGLDDFLTEAPEVTDWNSTDSLSADMEDKRIAYSVVVFPEEGKHGKHTKVFDDIEEAKDFADSVYPDAYSVVIRREEARGRFSGPAVIRRNGLWNDARKVNEAADSTKAKEIIVSGIDGSKLEIIEKNIIPNTNSFRATYVTGDSKGRTCTFVEADARGTDYLETLGFKPDTFNGDKFIDLPTECFETKGFEGSFYITKKDFSEYSDLKESKSIKEDALDDSGIATAHVSTLSERLPNSKFYIDSIKFILGKDLPDYFDTDEIISYSQFTDENNTRVTNNYKIIDRTHIDESKSIKITPDSKNREINIEDKSKVGDIGHPIKKGLGDSNKKLNKEGLSAKEILEQAKKLLEK